VWQGKEDPERIVPLEKVVPNVPTAPGTALPASPASAPAVSSSFFYRSMRKDPLDPIDGGTKVRIALRRILDPEAAKREAEKRKKEAEEAKAKAASEKKAGSWGGLPGRF